MASSLLYNLRNLSLPKKLIILAAVGMGMFFGFFLIMFVITSTIDIDKPLKAPQATTFYDINRREFSRVYQENRIEVTLDKMPDQLKQGFVDVEDVRFYSHAGFDLYAMGRAIWADIRGGGYKEGASTITQQLARNALLSQKQTMGRKIQEIFLAMHIEQKYTKDQILEKYLNRIYFGHGAYGVETASQLFFGCSVSDLKLHQIALLIGLPKNPSGFSPYLKPQDAKDRRAVVLDLMAKNGTITQEEADLAKTKSLDVVPLSPSKRRAAYFVDYVIQQMKKVMNSSIDENAIQTGGYQIYTTLDPVMQQAAEDAVSSLVGGNYDANGVLQPQMAIVAVDPRNGYIKAMVGGREFGNTQLNRAVDAYRQTGSAIKPFVYTAAIDTHMYTPDSVVKDEPVQFGSWAPQNYDFKFRGDITLRTALELSVNIVAVKVANSLGPEKVAEYAQRMGLKNLVLSGQPNDLNLASMALGGLTKGVTPLELVSAYTPLANKGIYSEPIAILEVKDSLGNTIYSDHPHQKVVLSESTAYIMTDMLRGVILRGSGTITAMNRPAAGKTGTTSDYTNAWFVGYTPDLAAAVWIGNDSQKIPVRIGNNVYGSVKSAEIWGHFMKQALSQSPILDFSSPQSGNGSVQTVEICTESGELATSNCPETRFETYADGTQPTQYCHIHGGDQNNNPGDNGNPASSTGPNPTSATLPNTRPQTVVPNGRRKQISVKICTESGLLATPYCPENQVVTETFTSGEEPTSYCNIHHR